MDIHTSSVLEPLKILVCANHRIKKRITQPECALQRETHWGMLPPGTWTPDPQIHHFVNETTRSYIQVVPQRPPD